MLLSSLSSEKLRLTSFNRLLFLLLSVSVFSSLAVNPVVMDKYNLQYSKKNIPVPSKHEYKRLLLANTISSLKIMRWKVHDFDGKINLSVKNTYGFATSSPDLVQFEKDIMSLIRSVEFRSIDNDFQKKMRRDVSDIRASGKVIVSADKSSNMYKQDKETYKSHLTNSITFYIQEDHT